MNQNQVWGTEWNPQIMAFVFSLSDETSALWNKGEIGAIYKGTGVLGLKSRQELSALHIFISHCRLQNIIELLGFWAPFHCNWNINEQYWASPNNNRDMNKPPPLPNCPDSTWTFLTQLYLATRKKKPTKQKTLANHETQIKGIFLKSLIWSVHNTSLICW